MPSPLKTEHRLPVEQVVDPLREHLVVRREQGEAHGWTARR